MVVEVFRKGTNPAFSQHLETIHDVKSIIDTENCEVIRVTTFSESTAYAFDGQICEFRVTP